MLIQFIQMGKKFFQQVVVQMRVPEISLENGLHAQNKHDLCRTISIQNYIDKLNTFQLTQFHLWWCQVCRAWKFRKDCSLKILHFSAAYALVRFWHFGMKIMIQI